MEVEDNEKRSETHGALELPMRVSYRVRTEVQEKSVLQRKERGNRKKPRHLCEWKRVTIVKEEVCPDYLHMLREIPPKNSVSSFMRYLKGKSSFSPLSLVISTSVFVYK